jgi:hypothetical protein
MFRGGSLDGNGWGQGVVVGLPRYVVILRRVMQCRLDEHLRIRESWKADSRNNVEWLDGLEGSTWG